jgi:hypothetical protein
MNVTNATALDYCMNLEMRGTTPRRWIVADWIPMSQHFDNNKSYRAV